MDSDILVGYGQGGGAAFVVPTPRVTPRANAPTGTIVKAHKGASPTDVGPDEDQRLG